jgi:hypothetical protein
MFDMVLYVTIVERDQVQKNEMSVNRTCTTYDLVLQPDELISILIDEELNLLIMAYGSSNMAINLLPNLPQERWV